MIGRRTIWVRVSGKRTGSTGQVVGAFVLEQALANAQSDTRTWIELKRCLGLRREQMIESHKSLKQ